MPKSPTLVVISINQQSILLLEGLESHTPQLSNSASPFGTPSQSAHDVLSPPHTPHASFTN